MTEDIVIFLGKMIEEVRDLDMGPATTGTGRYVRVRVLINAKEPLRRSLRVDLLREGKIKTMLLRCERLLDYCFKCGRLGHALRECMEPGEEAVSITEAQMRLNTWLRAVSPPKRFQHKNENTDRGVQNSPMQNHGRNGVGSKGKTKDRAESDISTKGRVESQPATQRKEMRPILSSHNDVGNSEGINCATGIDSSSWKRKLGNVTEGIFLEQTTETPGTHEMTLTQVEAELIPSRADAPVAGLRFSSGLGPIARLGGAVAAGPMTTPEREVDNLKSGLDEGECKMDIGSLGVETGKTQKPLKWKRVARGIRLTQGLGENLGLGKREKSEQQMQGRQHKKKYKSNGSEEEGASHQEG
ncbi:hypothetical protein Dsin_016659 [Dipteronia sinensis]|uniref:CCHC-type domain-containing protein n=1 Tax=Dipteronia sinensis TaxID=43782 RepID=A0AAE0AEA3_9ROSI|nr:hypothetical protein Dsin_016659 [Dipteronia sinensis]